MLLLNDSGMRSSGSDAGGSTSLSTAGSAAAVASWEGGCRHQMPQQQHDLQQLMLAGLQARHSSSSSSGLLCRARLVLWVLSGVGQLWWQVLLLQDLLLLAQVCRQAAGYH